MKLKGGSLLLVLKNCLVVGKFEPLAPPKTVLPRRHCFMGDSIKCFGKVKIIKEFGLTKEEAGQFEHEADPIIERNRARKGFVDHNVYSPLLHAREWDVCEQDAAKF